MSRNNHPIENEELMAYLDGELATERAVEAAAHLEHCQECQELAADLRQLSQEMMAWEVEPSETTEISTDIAVALEKPKKRPGKVTARRGWRTLLSPHRLAWGGGTAILFLLVMAITIPNFLRSRGNRPMATFYGPISQPHSRKAAGSPSGSPHDDIYSINGTAGKLRKESNGYTTSANSTVNFDSLQQVDGLGKLVEISPGIVGGNVADGSDSAQNSDGNLNVGDEVSKAPTVPMIARVAGLTLTTKEFEKTRGSLDEILKRYGGYLGQLQVSAPADTGRTLTATLRIPAPQLDAAMAELKKLGRVEGESQGGEEVTQQYVDLEARLANSKHTEQRLTEILTQRTGKLQDVLKVELEIDRVRGEIEQMQAEKKELSKRVAFATLNTTIQEEYQARLQATPPSTGSRFRNAAVDGYNTVVEGLISVGLFLFSTGPSLLLWAAILFFPARWAWRKFQGYSRQKHGDAEEEKAE